jgi:hypothetical protein
MGGLEVRLGYPAVTGAGSSISRASAAPRGALQTHTGVMLEDGVEA